MTFEDLRELLLSIAEEDAIIRPYFRFLLKIKDIRLRYWKRLFFME